MSAQQYNVSHLASAPSCSPHLSDRGADGSPWLSPRLCSWVCLQRKTESTEAEQTPRSNPNTQPGCSWRAQGPDLQGPHLPLGCVNSPAHSTQADQPMCTAGKEDFRDFSLPLNMLCPIPPSFSSSYIGGAATKINKTHSFVIPHIFPHQGCWQKTWPGFGKDCAGLVVVHTTHHCPVLPHTRTWHCLTSYTRSTSTGETAV